MADIVNLRQARKRKARSDRQKAADQNRILHGRSKAEKAVDGAERDRTLRLLDGHRRVTPTDGDERP